MKTLMTILTIIFLSGISIASENAHHHEQKKLSLNNGKKWKADQIMKTNMHAISSSLANTQKIKSNDYQQLSKDISESAQKIVASCKMEEKADQTFHVILGDLLMVADEVKDSKKSKQAVVKLEHALKIYSEYFE